MAGVRKHLDARSAEYMSAYNSGDAGKVAALYLEDCFYMMAPKPMQRTREGVKGAVSEFLKTTNKISFKAYDTTFNGTDTATECGSYTLQMRDGSPQVTGKYVMLWVKRGDNWFIKYDIGNTD